MEIYEIERTYLINGKNLIKVTIERKKHFSKFNIIFRNEQYNNLTLKELIMEYAKKVFGQEAELASTEDIYRVSTHDGCGCYWRGEYRRVYPSYLPTHYYIKGRVERVTCCSECLDSSVHILTANDIEMFFEGQYEHTVKKFSCGDKTIEVELEQNQDIEKSEVIIKDENDKIIREFDSVLELIADMFSE